MPDSTPRFRERKISYPSLGGTEITLGVINSYVNGSLVSSNTKKTSVAASLGTERCWDRINHPVNRKSRIFRANGPLTLLKVDCNTRASSPLIIGSNVGKPGITFGNRTEYRGVLACPLMTFDPDAVHYLDAGGLDRFNNPLMAQITSGMESTAWGKLKPKLERATAFGATYELREMPALLRATGIDLASYWSAISSRSKRIRMTPHEAADEFLSVQFGWLPFVRDVVKMLDSILHYRQYVQDLTSGNNRWLRRSKTLEETTALNFAGRLYVHGLRPAGEDINQLCVQQWDPNVGSYYGNMEVFHEISDRVWAVGYFKYYRPELDLGNPEFYSLVNTVRRRILLHGARINPSHLYQILPWSWLIDWFANLGSLIENLDAQANDSVVSRDLCIMREKTTKVNSIHSVYFYSGTVQFTTTRTIVSKMRHVASSPYGFVLGGDLTPSQWSILGALGLSRSVSFAKVN
jgi:hypothetical protein